MPGRASRIAFRIVSILCGLVTLVTALPYALLRGVDLPVQSEWIPFLVVLGVVGTFNIVAGCLPRTWIGKLYRKPPDDARLFSSPLKLVAWFAAISYGVAAFAYSAPSAWNLNPQVMLVLCPMYFLKMTFDPSPLAIFLLLAPMNAAVFGALGLALGALFSALRKRVA